MTVQRCLDDALNFTNFESSGELKAGEGNLWKRKIELRQKLNKTKIDWNLNFKNDIKIMTAETMIPT